MGHPFRIGVKLAGQDTTAAALRDVWRIADEGGLDHVWCFDHVAAIGEGGPDRPVFEGWSLQAAMAVTAEYLPSETDQRNPSDFTPELSRRARGVEVWAALRALGRSGVAEMIERNCAQARRFAGALSTAGFEILNDVVLNQVLVSFGEPERTKRVIERVQRDGTCWAGVTVWQGRTAMRISVCSWATTDADVERSIEAMLRAAREA